GGRGPFDVGLRIDEAGPDGSRHCAFEGSVRVAEGSRRRSLCDGALSPRLGLRQAEQADRSTRSADGSGKDFRPHSAAGTRSAGQSKRGPGKREIVVLSGGDVVSCWYQGTALKPYRRNAHSCTQRLRRLKSF